MAKFYLAVSLLACCSTVAVAQSGAPVTPPGAASQATQAPAGIPSDAAPAAPSAGSETRDEGDIIVTAQKRSERLQDVPISIVTQTGAQLARAGITNTRDLAAVTPGLTFSTTGAWSQPSLRGVSSTGTNPGAESPVAIYLDGIYQPSQNGQIFDLPDVSRVEILKGPQGTLFGRNATAGAIQIFTLDPSFETTGQISANVGAFTGGHARTALEYGFKGFASTPIINDVLAASISANYSDNDGYLRDVSRGGKRGGKVVSRLVRGKLLFKPADGVKFVATAYYGRRYDAATEAGSIPNGNSVGYGVPGAIVPTKPWTFAYDDPKPLYKTSSYGLSLRGDINIGGAGTLTTLTGYSHLKAKEQVDVDGSFVSTDPAARLAACPGCTAYRVNTPDHSFSQELDFASSRFGIFRVTAGLNYFSDSALQEGDANDGGFFFSDAVRTKAYAGFAEITASLTDRLTVIGGLRYNHETKTGFGAFFSRDRRKYQHVPYNSTTPRASVRYELSPQTNLFFTYSKGFKSGVLPNTCYTSDCPVAAPEKLTSFEGGIKSGSRDLSFSLSAFHYIYRDLQVLIFNGITSNTENAASARISGLDADATLRVMDGLHVRAAASWLPTAKFKSYPNAAVFFEPTPTIDASGTRLLRAPKLTGTASVDYTGEFHGGTLEASANLACSSSYRWDVTGQTVTKRYATLGARIGYQPAGSQFKFILYGRNLTNAAYIQGTLLDGSADLAFYAPPRNVGAQIDWSF